MTISHNIEWINPHLAAALAPVVGVPGYLVYALTEPLPGSDKPNKVPCNPETGRIEPPNDPTSRGVLTYQQAEAKADALGDRYGVGMHPAKFPDLVALDFDGCVEVTAEGTIRLAGWVSEIVGDGEVYCEVSPSMTGLRALLLDKVGHLKRLATGFERHNVGVYGAPGSGKFVTITGVTVEESALVVGEAPGVVSRVLTYFASKLGEDRVYGGGGLDYPMGLEGVKEAEADILSGASLHPAMMRIVTGLMNTSMPAQEIREHLIGLMQQSTARGSTRWATRMRGIDGATGIMSWVSQRQGYRAQDRNGIEQQRATARALVERFSGRWKGAEGVEHPKVNGTAHAPQPGGERAKIWVEPANEQEQLAVYRLQKIMGEDEGAAGLYLRSRMADGLTMDQVVAEAQEIFETTAEAVEAEEALAAVEELRSTPVEAADWEMVERAPAAFQSLVRTALSFLPREYPEVAVMAALSALSAATQNGFAVRGELGLVTPLNTYAVALAPSGAVKSFVEGFIGKMLAAAGTVRQSLQPSAGGLRNTLAEYAFRTTDTEPPVAKWPSVMITVDEIGMMLQRLGGSRGKTAGHEDHVLAMLFELSNKGSGWGASLAALEEQRLAGKVRPRIECPYVTVAGFSTLSSYYTGTTQALIESGYGNRMLTFSADYEAPDRDPGYRLPSAIPAELVELMEGLRVWTWPERREGGSRKGTEVPADSPWHRPQRIIELPDELIPVFAAERARLRAAFAEAGLPRVMLQRFYEMSAKVAALLSVWELLPMVVDLEAWDAKVEVSAEAAEYAVWLVSHLLVKSGQEYLDKANSTQFMENVTRVVDIAKQALLNPDNPPGVMASRRAALAAHLRRGAVSRSYLTYRAKLSPRDLDDVLKHLVEGGTFVHAEPERAGDGKGRQAELYRLQR